MQSSTPFNSSVGSQPTILVTEGDEDNLLYISSAFALFGYHCISTQDSSVYLSLVQIYQPNLVILDVNLPDLTGINLIRQLKLNPTTQNIPAIAATTMARAKEKEFILNAGFDNYLLKPFFLENLEQMVSYYLTQQFAAVGKTTA